MSSSTINKRQDTKLDTVTAVLGPTNTGKTHMAIERMLRFKSGMIGLPLRLLAREIYDRCKSLRPDKNFALITGEEKILPQNTDYFICTVESMPSDRETEFLAIDEIQLCSDTERGHVFTDRMLNWRGTKETLFLGADTIKPLLENLSRGINFKTRPRLSKLSYGGIKKISRLPRRTAIVTFNAETIYATAELVRRQKGGAAVVMGSLSPRTRNAQVDLFQSGDVPYLVATDAIGMGLNLNLDHVAFAGTRKFDGKKHRDLMPSEISQIAGRAGRYMNDGTFGTTGNASPFDEEMIGQIENHILDPIKSLYWRNPKLDFSSIENLQLSLQLKSQKNYLHRPVGCTDTTALIELSKQTNIREMANTPASLRNLWDVCQIPDYRNISPSEHHNILGNIFTYLQNKNGTIPEEWLSKEVNYADRSEGDIDTLANRLAHIRTWTYVSNRHNWLDDSLYWQEKTRAIEDKLSDALHQRLMARFVDRKTSLLMKRLRQREDVKVSLMEDGKIIVENETIGSLKAFQFESDHAGTHKEDKDLKSASSEIISEELKKRADRFLDEDIVLEFAQTPHLLWQGHIIASLKSGDTPLKLSAEFIADDLLPSDAKEKISTKINQWLEDHLKKVLEPLFSLNDAQDIEGLARGVAFQIIEARGILPRESIAKDIKALDQESRKQLRKYGVRFGAYHIFMPILLKPAPAKMLLFFWALENNITHIPDQPPNGLTSLVADTSLPEGFYTSLGYKVCGSRAARIDMLERLADMIRPVIFWRAEKEEDSRPEGSYQGGGFTVTPDMMSLLGCSGEEFSAVLTALGYYAQKKPTPLSSSPTPETSAEATQPKEEESKGETAEENAPETLIEVWLPNKKKQKPTGPKKKKPIKKSPLKPNRRDKKNYQSKQKPIRPEDSPFAALLSLKKK